MNVLTKTQKKILSTIEELTDKRGIPPTQSDITRAMGYRSNNSTVTHLHTLKAKGAISIKLGKARSICIKKTTATSLTVPLIHSLTLDKPILSSGNIVSDSNISSSLFPSHADFLYRIKATNLPDIDFNIFPNDLIAIKFTTKPLLGQVIAIRDGNDIRLTKLSDTDIPAHTIGVVIGMIRTSINNITDI